MASRKAESGAGRLACDAKAREFLERLVAKYSKAGVAEFVHRMDELATKQIYNEAGRKKPGIRCGPTQPYSEAFLRVEQARALLVREGRRPTIALRLSLPQRSSAILTYTMPTAAPKSGSSDTTRTAASLWPTSGRS